METREINPCLLTLPGRDSQSSNHCPLSLIDRLDDVFEMLIHLAVGASVHRFQISSPPRQAPSRPSRANTLQKRLRFRSKPCIVLRAFDQQSSPETGQMSAAVIDSMKNKIQEALDADKVEITDVEGDARHVTINVVSSAFEGVTWALYSSFTKV